MEAGRALDQLVSRFSLLGAVVAAVVVAGQPGCSSKGLSTRHEEVPAPESTSQSALSSTMNFAIYAQNSANLRDRVEVHGGDVGVKQVAASPPLVSGFELVFSSGALTDGNKIVFANRLQLWDQANVGPLQVNTLSIPHANATHGPQTPLPASMPDLPPLATVSPGTTALNVTASTPIANPGSYGAVSVGNAATWKLRTGVYHLASLHIENDAHVEVLGPVQIRIAGRLDALDRTWIVPAAGVTITAGDLRIEVSGKNGAGGSLADWPKSAQLGTDAHVSGVMLVPKGTLQFGARAVLKGAYLAQDVYIDNDGKVNYQSGVGPSGCLQSCDDGLPCTVDTCANGACTHSNAPAGASCSDGNACNGAETCNGAGQCLSGTPPPPCQALDQCHGVGTCNPATGLCSNPVKADGTACNDGNACTRSDLCTAGACHGIPYTCDDHLPCTSDTCNGDGTCTYGPVEGTCYLDGSCLAANAPNPDNRCEQCTPEASHWAWSPTPAGTACDDQNTCTKADQCDGAHACVGTPYTCDDGLTCTVDMCVGDGSCSFQPVSGSCAIDGACHVLGDTSPNNQCMGCEPGQGTAWSNKPDGHGCNDNDTDTNGDACTMGQCQGTKACAPFADISSGGAHNCAVRNDGSLWCWGRNESGQLGTGTQNEKLGPMRAGDTRWNWSTVSAGGQHTCAIRIDTTLWCWGDNTFGQIGDGSTDLRLWPVQVGGSGWSMVVAGKRSTCGVYADGVLACWGDNSSGNLGNGSQDASLVPVEVVGSNWTAVAVGYDHACGLKGDHTLWCWGANGSGQLGDGTTGARLTPVQVSGTDWSGVTAGPSEGDAFTCAIRLDGGLWCWGDNASGQLGLGTQTSSKTPVRVGNETWSTVSAAGGRASGIRAGRTMWSWGKNELGQLGDGTQNQRLSPVRVLGNNWVQATAGETHGCGRRQVDGSLWCWGDNSSWAVRPNIGAMSLSPTQVTGLLCNPVSICGNGIQEAGEDCDDGNHVGEDGCSWDCRKELCFGVSCPASSNQCDEPGKCDPADGQCKYDRKQNGSECDDGNACTQTDTCQEGQCAGGNEKQCPASNCFEAGTCVPETGKCENKPIDKMGCNINLLEPAVVKMDDGSYIAIFGYDSEAKTPFHPTENTVTPSLTQSPYPPAYLLHGTHQGAFLPRLTEGQTITWNVDGDVKSVTANPATALTPTPNGSGIQVNVGGTIVDIEPDLYDYMKKPDDPVGDKGVENLPSGSSFEPTLPGQLSVSPTGAAVYTVPIKIPPGVGGMAPNLNLVYNSQSGYGVAGIGWSLTGLSVIHRCPKTLASDGYSQPINMDGASVASDSGDGVCMDGKRLIYNSSLGRFKPEMEDFTDIVYQDDNDRFVVTTKSGEKRIYGMFAQVQFPMEDADGIIKTDAGSPKVTAIWALDRVEDVWGNFYVLGYNEGSVGSFEDAGLLVTSIAYTGHMENRAQIPGIFEIGFEYESRSLSEDDGYWPDTGRTRFRDSYLPNNKRLKTILIRRSGEERAHYSLGYRAPNSAILGDGPTSRLEGIHYCVGSGCNCASNACASAHFGWGTESGDPSMVDWSAEQKNYLLRVDRMGLGTQLVDINGDGLVDLVQAVRGYGESHAWLNTGAGWVPKDEWKLPPYVALGEPKEALTDSWEDQAWQQMKCLDPDTGGYLPGGGHTDHCFVSVCEKDPLRADCATNWCDEHAKDCNESLKKTVDADKDDLPDLTPSGTVFADIDGDGFLDLITDREPGPDGKKPGSARPAVYFNKTRVNGGVVAWERQEGLSGDNLSEVLDGVPHTHGHPLDLTPLGPQDTESNRYSLTDIDGDGHAELVFAGNVTACGSACCPHQISVFRANLSTGRWENDPGQGIDWAFLSEDTGPYLFSDVNRDGLPDVVDSQGYLVAVNTGAAGKGLDGTRWRGNRVPDPKHPTHAYCQTISVPTGPKKFQLATGDLDGDGFYDQVIMRWKVTEDGLVIADPPGGQPASEATKIFIGTGAGWNDGQADSFKGALFKFLGPNSAIDGRLLSAGRYRFQFADLNADGRADAIVNYPWGGLFLLNTGKAFVDVEGHHSYSDFDPERSPPPTAQLRPVPTKLNPSQIKAAEPFDSFIDLDGDGIPDRIQLLRKESNSEVFKGAWLNKYQKPVIRSFPNVRATDTLVGYVGINTLEGRSVSDSEPDPVYTDDSESLVGTKHMAAPLVVVKSVLADDGLGAKNTTDYRYKNLRASSIGKGPAGFREITSVDETKGISTTTTYAQAYPYTGMPRKIVRRDRKGNRITQTETNYCDRPGVLPCSPEGIWLGGKGEVGVFVHPSNVTDTTFLRDTGEERSEGQESIIAVTGYEFDAYGNPKSTTVTTSSDTEKYTKIVTNDYGSAGSETAIHGKPLSTLVTSQQLLPQDGNDPGPLLHHRTNYEYTPELAISKKKVESGSGRGTEVHTAYKYDIYGNLEITTACASDFDKCEPGTENPSGDPEDPLHPPFRTSHVSFKTAEFKPGSTAPTQSLTYSDGMYPVKSTNALGHVQYTAYDDFLGAVVQSTGPNGFHTCFEYDSWGFKTAEVARCGAKPPERELRTTITRYSATKETLTKTEPPVGPPTMVRSDSLGRTVEAITYDFHGNLVHVDTEYDNQGRVARVSKPHPTSVTGAQRSLTTTKYDWLGRIESVTDDLGSLDGGNVVATGVITTTYAGISITTTQTVKGQKRARTEWKNALGKVSKIEDANGNPITYAYDPDGNLTDTKDPAGNIVHLEYDVLGRKKLTRDPDLGTWSYGYNGFGDLIEQIDAKNQSALLPTKMTYDQLGRMRAKTDPAGNTAEWVYDLGQAGIGKLSASISPPSDKLTGDCAVPGRTDPTSNRAVRQLAYNEFGDLSEVKECVRGDTFVTTYGYDSYGRQNQITYPEVNGARLSVESVFSSTGFLHYLADGNDPDRRPYWVAKEMNPAGQVTKEYTRNGVEVVSNRNTATGWLLGSKATAVPRGGDVIQDLSFTFDEVGSLASRTRGESQYLPELSETFTYDKLDRLHTAEIRIPSASGYLESETFDFDNLGNISKKGGRTYSYTGCNAGPHALCSVGGGAAYTYDANGNMTKGNGRSVDYDSANKPVHIKSDANGATIDFAYGADGHRVLQEVASSSGGDPSRTVYVGLGATGKSIYERTTTGSDVEHVQFLYAGSVHGGNAIALRVTAGATGSAAMKYNLFDHLGSVTATTDHLGRVVGPASDPANSTLFWYDAWGARRNPDGSRTSTPTNLQPGHREYTGHETIPQVGLVNMNGRVYDPDLGRFLSPDPNVQFTGNLQSYNRYSYVLNNPLRYTDPTGYWTLGTLFFDFVTSPRTFNAAILVAGCAFGSPAACVGATLMVLTINATTMAMAGASFDQIVLNLGVQVAASSISGGIAGGMVGEAGGSLGMSVLAGAISGGIGAAIATPLATGSFQHLGENILDGALYGAATAAATWAGRNTNPVSVESAAEQQGGGGGRGAVAADGPLGEYDDAEYEALMAQRRGENVDPYARMAKEALATENGGEGASGNPTATDAPKYNGGRFNGDQEAAVDLAQDAKQKGGVTKADAETLVKWGKEVGFKDPDYVRGPEDHGNGPHIHVGPVNHIPVVTSVSIGAAIGATAWWVVSNYGWVLAF